MINQLINTTGIIINLIGTVFTLWSMISITKEDMDYRRTAKYHDDGPEEELTKQKHQVICGLIIISVGSIIQIISMWI